MFADGEGITVLTISMNVNRTHVETARLVTILPQILRSLLMRSNADVQLAGWVQFAQWTLMSAILYRAWTRELVQILLMQVCAKPVPTIVFLSVWYFAAVSMRAYRLWTLINTDATAKLAGTVLTVG
jgi:hypothetical protein